MSDQKKKKAAENTRDSVLNAALLLMEQQGDLSFSLRKLADAAHTSTMSIYTYFGNREGLYRALATRAFATFSNDIEHALNEVPDQDVVQTLLRLADVYRQLALDHPSTFDLIFGGELGFDRVAPLSDQFEGLPSPSQNGYDAYGAFFRVFENGVRQRVFRSDVPVRLLMDSYWSQLHGLVVLERLGYVRSTEDAKQRFCFGVRSLLRGLSPENEGRNTSSV